MDGGHLSMTVLKYERNNTGNEKKAPCSWFFIKDVIPWISGRVDVCK